MREKRLTLVATILASAVVFIDTTVVNVALPALREEFDAGLAAQQWVVEAYLLTLSSLLLVGGSLGDLLGRRRVFVAGLVGFGVTSALCAVAPSVELLVAGRVLPGLGALTFFSVLFVQQVGGYSAFEDRIAFMPISLILFLLPRRFAALAERSVRARS